MLSKLCCELLVLLRAAMDDELDTIFAQESNPPAPVEKPRHCVDCNVSFRFPSRLQRHMENTHGKATEICEVCTTQIKLTADTKAKCH